MLKDSRHSHCWTSQTVGGLLNFLCCCYWYCCAFQGGLVFLTGDLAPGGYGGVKVCLDPHAEIIGADSCEGFLHRFCCDWFQKRWQAGEQTGEAALGMLAFQLFVKSEQRFQDLRTHG